MINVWTDGLCEPRNPSGVATYGVLIRHNTNPKFTINTNGVVGEGKGMTSVVAEYAGVVKALELLGRLQTEQTNAFTDGITFYTDSQIVAYQMSGEWKAHQGEYMAYFLKARELAKQFPTVKFLWVPREENEEADCLSRAAYEDYCAKTAKTPKYHKSRE